MEHRVTQEEDGKRLREILRQSMQVSYSAMKSAKWNGRILLNGAFATVDVRVKAGDLVCFSPKESDEPTRLRPYQLPLTIPYEDESLLVIDKQAPLSSQSSRNHPDDSLENAVYAYMGCPESYLYRPVNRLDKGTSGLMVVAKDAHTQQLLQRRLHTDGFIREYLAVVEGVPSPESGTVDAPIAKEDAASVKRVVSPDGKPSVTHYRLIGSDGRRALIRLRLETGRTHQIRVHMAHIGCPVAGDFLYGTELDELPGRFALHACALTLTHPHTGALLTLESPLPDAMKALLDQPSQPTGFSMQTSATPSMPLKAQGTMAVSV